MAGNFAAMPDKEEFANQAAMQKPIRLMPMPLVNNAVPALRRL
jgi:hypothetical protein